MVPYLLTRAVYLSSSLLAKSMRFAVSTFLRLYSLNFLIWASATMWGVYQAALYLWPTGRLTQLLIAFLAFPTHLASKRVFVNHLAPDFQYCRRNSVGNKLTILRRISFKRHQLYFRESGTLFKCMCNDLPVCLVWLWFGQMRLWHLANWQLSEMPKWGYDLVEGVSEVLTINFATK